MPRQMLEQVLEEYDAFVARQPIAARFMLDTSGFELPGEVHRQCRELGGVATEGEGGTVRYAFPDGTNLVVGSHVWLRAEFPAGKEQKPHVATRCEKLEFDENGMPTNLLFIFKSSAAGQSGSPAERDLSREDTKKAALSKA